MRMIVGILIALYIWAAVPVLFGTVWTEAGIKGRQHGILQTYLTGLVGEWAVFFLVAKWSVISGKSLRELCVVWMIVLIILTVISVARGIKEHRFLCRKPNLHGIWCLPVLIGICIFCGGVHQDDYTVEDAWTMYATDSLYEYDAATGHHADEMPAATRRQLEEKAKAPIEAYYAANSFLCKWNPAKYIGIVLPVFLLPFYFGVYQMWGETLFPNARGKKILFQVIVWLLYGLALVSEQNLIFGIFTNCWNGETLFYTGLVPLAVLLLTGETDKKKRVIQYILCALAGQLLCADGCFVMTFLWGIALLAEGVRRWKYDRSV